MKAGVTLSHMQKINQPCWKKQNIIIRMIMNKYDAFHLIKKKHLILVSLISTLYREFSFPKVDLDRASGLDSLSTLLQKGYYPKQLDSIMWLVHWDPKLLLEWTLLMTIYIWVWYVVRKLAEHDCMLKLFQTILHTSVYGTCFPIQQDHLLLWQTPRYTSAFFGTQITQPKGTQNPLKENSIRRLSWGCSIQIQFGNIFSVHSSIWIWKLWKRFFN